jgi:fumarate reductase subunit C
MPMQATKTKELIRPMKATWWLERPNYTRFMVRELTSVFVAGYAFMLMRMLYLRVAGDQAAFTRFVECKTGWTFQVIALAFVLFHAVTWFNLTPKVVIIWRGEERVPAPLIAGAHYVMWLVASLVVLWLAL